MHELGRPAPSGPRWRVNPRNAPELPASIAVPIEGTLVFGRDEDCDVRFPAHLHPDVSGKHARVTEEGGALRIEDLDSTNGTFVDAERIESSPLSHGATVELGRGGPRFVIVSSARLDETMAMRRPQGALKAAKKMSSIGDDTMHLVRAKLGIPESGVEELVKRRSGRNRKLMSVLSVVFALVLGGAFWFTRERARENSEALATVEAENVSLRKRLEEHRASLEAQRIEWQSQTLASEQLRLAWEKERLDLEADAQSLRAAISGIEANEASSRGELGLLRTRLDETNETLAAYNPLTLESQRLEGVARVERATVLIEADQIYREEDGERQLFIDRSIAAGMNGDLNLEGRGEPFALEATGSGFAITDEGWIVTNAHVVHKKNEAQPLSLGDLNLVPDVDLRVVFTGESTRHAAKLIAWVADGKDDLALLKIEPFEDMPFIDPPDLDAPPPLRGSDVFLIGFPLGKRVLHEGNRMLASTFQGVLSRELGDYLQVDAAVHPGASGGPLIDAMGNLIGVVVGMQALDEKASSSQIGYILPVAKMKLIWPPEVQTDADDS